MADTLSRVKPWPALTINVSCCDRAYLVADFILFSSCSIAVLSLANVASAYCPVCSSIASALQAMAASICLASGSINKETLLPT